MTVQIMRFTKLLLGLVLAACAGPLSGQNARQEIYANPDKAGGVYYAYTYDNPARTPAPEGYEPFYISHYGRHGSRWLLRASEYAEVLETFGKAAREGDEQNGSFMCGQIAGLVNKEQPAAEIIREMFAQAEELLKGAAQWVR